MCLMVLRASFGGPTHDVPVARLSERRANNSVCYEHVCAHVAFYSPRKNPRLQAASPTRRWP